MNKKELLLQLTIIFVCLLSLVFHFVNEPIQAQMFCNGQPPVWPNPLREAWPQGRQVSVVIFDTPNQSEFQAISDGIRAWNSHSLANCAGVTFGTPTPANHPYVNGEHIPDDTIFIIRPANSQWDPSFVTKIRHFKT